MTQKNDVELLYSSIDANPESYQEILQDQGTAMSLKRWPLIAAINHATPANAFTHLESLSVALEVEQIVIAKMDVAVIPNFTQSQIIQKVISPTNVELLHKVNENAKPKKVQEEIIAPLALTPLTSAFVVDTAHINTASSDDISSIFARLKRS